MVLDSTDCDGLINTHMKDASDSLGEQPKKLLAFNKASATGASKEAGEQYNLATQVIIGAAIIAALMNVLLTWLLTRSIVAPLSRTVRAAQDIAEGDLTYSRSASPSADTSAH
jgi:methyl-accepting chemotaxis protein